MLGALERQFHSEQNEQTRGQIEYLDNEIRECKLEDERLYRAYLADAFDEAEYAEHRSLITNQPQKLQSERNKLEAQLMLPEKFEERKQEILFICENAHRSGLALNAPFHVRKRIISTIVDRIILNANEGWFELEGVISGQYLFDDTAEEETNEGGNGQGNRREGFRKLARNAPSASASFGLHRRPVRLRLTSRIRFRGEMPILYLTA